MSALPLDGGSPMWPPWARGAKRPSATSPDPELDGTCIPLADLRSSVSPDSPAHGIPLVPAHPTSVPWQANASQNSGPPAVSFTSPLGENQADMNRSLASSHFSSSSSSCSSSSTTISSSSPPPTLGDQALGRGGGSGTPSGETAADERQRLQFDPPAPDQPYLAGQPGKTQQLDPGPAVNPGEFMRGIAAEARAWSVRVIAGGSAREDVDPVKMLLPDSAMGQRIGGPGGRGPLLRRLEKSVYGMMDDFMVVTVTRPGPLYVRLRPDARGLVIVNNFDLVPDDPLTGCPRLGPVEGVGVVMPGDALVSVNREVLFGRPFSECVKHIRDASSSATAAIPCLLCFRKADPNHLEAKLGAPPRNLEQEKIRALGRLLEGGEGGLLDEAKLRGITSSGVPDTAGLRPILWRYLLQCLPTNRSQWSDHLETQRKLYARFVQDFILTPAEIVTQGGNSSRGEGPRLGGETLTASAVREAAATAIGSGAADAPKTAHTSPHRGSIDPHGSPGGDTPTPRRAEGSSSGGGGAEGVVHAMNGSPERDHPAAEDAAKSTTETTAGVSSPESAASERSPGGACVSQELRPAEDDPLSSKETSEWAALWSDKELMQAIDQDVVRTMPDLAFYACRGGEDDDNKDADSEARREQQRQGRERREAIARVLFVHAKLNPAESYTQGMNEIVATLYYVLATDGEEEWSEHCEADTFFCFTNLMSEIRDVFIQSLDESESGLLGKMQAFSRTLHQHDPELADHMANLALDPRYYALRWFTTLLSREFDLPDTIRLWDSLFASQDRSEFLVFVFVTLMLGQREELLAGDFASNLQLLQSYPPTEVPEILAQSEALRLFSARGDAARTGGLNEQLAREASDGAKQAAEHVNAAARRFWNAATDLAAGAAERMATMADGEETLEVVFTDSGGGGDSGGGNGSGGGGGSGGDGGGVEGGGSADSGDGGGGWNDGGEGGVCGGE